MYLYGKIKPARLKHKPLKHGARHEVPRLRPSPKFQYVYIALVIILLHSYASDYFYV